MTSRGHGSSSSHHYRHHDHLHPKRFSSTLITAQRRLPTNSTCLFRFLFAVYAAFLCRSYWKSSSSHKPMWHAGQSSTTRTSDNNNNNNTSQKKRSDLLMMMLPGQQQPLLVPGTSPSSDTTITTTSSSGSSTGVGVLVFDETPQQLIMLNKLFCMGKFGLGHRLSKLAAAYHLTCHVLHDLPRLQVHWGSCSTTSRRTNNNNHSNSQEEHDDDDNEVEIFASLFGSNRLQCPPSSHPLQQQQLEETEEARRSRLYQNKTVVVRNDVVGYYAGQAYKNAQVPIDVAALSASASTPNSSHKQHHAWSSKLNLDTVLFQDLLHHFHVKNSQRIQAFQQEHDWNTTASSKAGKSRSSSRRRLVIGLHIRAGNGEQDHFQAARRDSIFDTKTNATTDAATTFASRLASLIHQLIHHYYQYHYLDMKSTTTTMKYKAPLVFLATDTADFIPILQNAFANLLSSSLTAPSILDTIKVVSFPQERVPAQHGVSYQQWTQGELCRNGWRDSMMDMAMLAQSDIVVAATRSTFTQILPQALVWKSNTENDDNNTSKKPRLKFCQVGRRHHTGELLMSCFANQRAWLFGPPIGNGGNQGEQVKTFVSQLSNHAEEGEVENERQRMSIADTVETTTRSLAATTATDAGVLDRHGSVVHKILVHLPDVEPDSLTQRALNFLRAVTTAGQTFAYGRRIATKYRGKGNEAFRADWTSI